MTDKEIFASNLKRLMDDKGLSATDICIKLDIPMSTFSDWTNGKNYPRRTTVLNLADFFGVDKKELTEEYVDRAKIISDNIFSGICKDFEEIGEIVPEFKVKKARGYLKEIIDLYLSNSQLEELVDYALFIKNRDARKKDRQD